jgi:hypothetical protein
MTLDEIKKEMKEYRDFYGQDLLDSGDIDNCKSILSCESLIERHRCHIEAMFADANSHLDDFKRRIGVY